MHDGDTFYCYHGGSVDQTCIHAWIPAADTKQDASSDFKFIQIDLWPNPEIYGSLAVAGVQRRPMPSEARDVASPVSYGMLMLLQASKN